MPRVMLMLLALCCILGPTTLVRADVYEQLQGEWIAELEDAPAGREIRLTFVDRQTVRVAILHNGQEMQVREARYEATDTQVTFYYDEDDDEGEQGAWHIDDDGKLHLIDSEEGEEGEEQSELILHRA